MLPLDTNNNSADVTVASSYQHIMETLAKKHLCEESTVQGLLDLRYSVLSLVCPDKLRGRVWKLLLLLPNVSASCYINIVHRGPSLMDTKIRNDTFRTMTTDTSFLEHVSEDMLIRVLNAFVWISRKGEYTDDTSEEIQLRQYFQGLSSSSKDLTYVQGMNILAAPFLMAMPEMEAFYSFSTFLWRWCPLYVHPTLKGVHCGVRLVDLCLAALDPTLYGYLLGRGLTASIYAFPSVLSFSACTPPLSELLQLWDVMFAFGAHLNILYIISQIALVRRELLQSSSPMKILRKLPPLQARPIINIAMVFCKKLPVDLYEKLVRHAYDESVADELGVKVVADFDQPQNDVSGLPDYMTEAMGSTRSFYEFKNQ
ncbi:rab-GTPase-TBC domain-containing protein [Phycomyces nitens]|nr:rab-GTPase-TBC domain-containing protein [Phycomyces nitens]